MVTKSILERQFDFTNDVVKLIEFANSKRFNVVIKECYRPPEVSEHYKNIGLSWLANPKDDRHTQGLAADICFFIGNSWIKDWNLLDPLGDFWTKLRPGNVWGGYWKVRDCLHFQGV